MWDRHLLELLHLAWEEGHAHGQGRAGSSESASAGLVAAQASPDTWLPGCTSGLSAHTLCGVRGQRPKGCGLGQGRELGTTVSGEARALLGLGAAQVGPGVR